MPLDATNRDDVYVDSHPWDISMDGKKGLVLFVCGDRSRRGH
jgi:hypothetical protein